MRIRLFVITSAISLVTVGGVIAVVQGQLQVVDPSQAVPVMDGQLQLVDPSQPIPVFKKSTSQPILKTGAPKRIAGAGPIARGGLLPLPTTSNIQVDWGLVLDAPTLALYESMANLLCTSAIPNDRLAYFAAVNNPPDYVITGWGGMVTDVQLVCGGYFVTVMIEPDLSTTQYGSVTQISSNYWEQYYVDVNNVVQYAGFLDPNGMAGKMPLAFWID